VQSKEVPDGPKLHAGSREPRGEAIAELAFAPLDSTSLCAAAGVSSGSCGSSCFVTVVVTALSASPWGTRLVQVWSGVVLGELLEVLSGVFEVGGGVDGGAAVASAQQPDPVPVFDQAQHLYRFGPFERALG
jgi:hypothetical protein